MLLRTFVIVAFIALFGSSIVQGSAALARARVHRAAEQAADRAFALGVSTYSAGIATAIAAGADPRSVTATPAPTATCALTVSSNCVLTASTTFTPTTQNGVDPSADANGDCAPRCAENLQENDAIAEGRVAVLIRVAIANASGEIYTQRNRYAIFRTLRLAPYVALAGTRDATDEAIADGSSEGDDAGMPATTIDVRYVNAQSGASYDAAAWRSKGWNDANATGTAWDP